MQKCGMDQTHVGMFLPAAVDEQLSATTPEQAGLWGSSRLTLNHDLSPSGSWDQFSYWIQPKVWRMDWEAK